MRNCHLQLAYKEFIQYIVSKEIEWTLVYSVFYGPLATVFYS